MIKVAVLGATGMVGQKMIALLQDHPLFEVCELVASRRSARKPYGKACTWRQNVALSEKSASLTVLSLEDPLRSSLLFSGLDSSVAFQAEKAYADSGHMVISNAKNHRMEKDVPLVVPEINHEHIEAVRHQARYKKNGGGIITNPNCSTIALVLAVAPLHKKYKIKKMIVQSMQAISGAGYPGVASLDIVSNIVPYIEGEEEKIETETKKILGGYTLSDGFSYADINVSAHANRVPVIDGHMLCVSLSFQHPPKGVEEIISLMSDFSGFPQQQGLYSAPAYPIRVCKQKDRPQPVLDVWRERGMATIVGRIRECSVLQYKFICLSHNTVRGAAGCAVLNAETAFAMGIVRE